MRIKSILRVLVISALLAGCTANCGVLVERNRVLTGFLDENLAPESPVARVALAPVAVPVGMASMSVDAVLLNPISQMPEAAELTFELIGEVPFMGVGEILVFPMRVITAPFLFCGIVLANTFLPLD